MVSTRIKRTAKSGSLISVGVTLISIGVNFAQKGKPEIGSILVGLGIVVIFIGEYWGIEE